MRLSSIIQRYWDSSTKSYEKRKVQRDALSYRRDVELVQRELDYKRYYRKHKHYVIDDDTIKCDGILILKYGDEGIPKIWLSMPNITNISKKYNKL